MLVVAGSLEAFLSPTHAPVALKFAVCACLLTGLGFWLSEGGRRKDSDESLADEEGQESSESVSQGLKPDVDDAPIVLGLKSQPHVKDGT